MHAAAAAPFSIFVDLLTFTCSYCCCCCSGLCSISEKFSFFPLACCCLAQEIKIEPETHDKTIILNASHRNKFVKETHNEKWFKVSKRNHTENYRIIYSNVCEHKAHVWVHERMRYTELGIAPGNNNSSLRYDWHEMVWCDVRVCVCATSRRSKPTATRNIDKRLDSVAQNENTFRNENHRMCFVDHKIQINSRN